jgi:hypothetical protein
MTHCAAVAQRKGNGRQGHGRENFPPRTQKELMDSPRMQQWNKELSPQRAITPEKQEDIQQDLQEGPHAGDHEAKSQTFTEK